MVSSGKPDLWTLALDRQQIGSFELADALQEEVRRSPLDFRTRLLIRDSLSALDAAWGDERFSRWLSESPQRGALNDIRQSSLGPAGFPSLVHRIMEPTRTDTVLQFFRELGQTLPEPATIAVGGSIALMLNGKLSRRTEDIDVVDEVPVQIRSQHELLGQLAQRYGLQLTHFQSDYLPAGWNTRLKNLDTFGRLNVQLVDDYDIILSKLFSAREKDRDDLRVLVPQLDKQVLVNRLVQTTQAMRSEHALRSHAEKNWYIILGEQLPT